MQKTTTYCCILITICFFSCKESFEPNLPVVPQGYLVVEGVINADGPTQIKLSRTTPLDDNRAFKAEGNARVQIEGDDNSLFTLSAQPNGLYISNTLPINASRKYRIRIKTKDAKEYVSEYVSVKITPPIDSINWKQENGGVQIYVSTHDPQNKTTYYRWDFDETWEIHSRYYAWARFENGAPRPSNSADPDISICWKYDTSSSIILGSSAKLRNDIISMGPLVFISREDERLGVRYSINVRQYALDKDGYLFMEQMKKNTESLGTIFDPLPSELKGNIRSVSDVNEPVIGYVSANTINEKRFFIYATQLSGIGYFQQDCDNIVLISTNFCCINDTQRPVDVKEYYPALLPYEPIYGPFGIITDYKVSNSECVDCRLRQASNIKPIFW